MSPKPEKPKVLSLLFFLSFVFSTIAFPFTSEPELPVQTLAHITLPKQVSQDTKDTAPKRSVHRDAQSEDKNLVLPSLIKHTLSRTEHSSMRNPPIDPILAFAPPAGLSHMDPTSIPAPENAVPRSQIPEEPTLLANFFHGDIFDHPSALPKLVPSAAPPPHSKSKLEAWSHQEPRKESIWSALVFITPGERTPSTNLNDGNRADTEATLTKEGVQQMKDLGNMFRRRYLPGRALHPGDEVSFIPMGAAGITETLDQDIHDSYIQDSFFGAPHRNHTRFIDLSSDPNPADASISTLETSPAPESGIAFWDTLFYNYPSIHTVSFWDPEYVDLDGSGDCVAHSHLRDDWKNSGIASSLSGSNIWVDGMGAMDMLTFLHLLSQNFPEVENLYGEEFWRPDNAGDILDSVRAYGSAEKEPYFSLNGTGIARDRVLEILGHMQTVVLYSMYGDLTAENTVRQGIANPEAGNATSGSISTIGGAALARRVRDTLSFNVEDEGTIAARLDILVAEVEQLVSLLVLTSSSLSARVVPTISTMPSADSAIAFEVFSLTDTEVEQSLPGVEALKVRLSGNLDTDYRIKHSSMEPLGMFEDYTAVDGMPYLTFLRKMEEIALGGTGDWCLQCGNQTGFCAPYVVDDNTTERVVKIIEVVEVEVPGKVGQRQMRPAVAGVLGAIILLSIFSVVAGSMGCCGVRCYRDRTKAVKGFKGNKKLGPEDDVGGPRDAVSRGANGGESWELTSPSKAFTKGRDSFDSGVKTAIVSERV